MPTIQVIRTKVDIGGVVAGTELRVDKIALRASPLKQGVDYTLHGTLPKPVQPDAIPVHAPSASAVAPAELAPTSDTPAPTDTPSNDSQPTPEQ